MPTDTPPQLHALLSPDTALAPHAPLSPSLPLRLAGNLLCGVAALASVCGLALYWIYSRMLPAHPSPQAERALRLYDMFYAANAVLLPLCALGGLVLLALGLAFRLRRLFWQGLCCFGLALCWWWAAAVYAFLVMAQFTF